jgi:hypothetical protein
MNDYRWGFENAEEWDETGSTKRPAEEPVDTVVGEDADRVVTVTVTRGADVVSVNLAANWQRLVDPRGLHSSVAV